MDLADAVSAIRREVDGFAVADASLTILDEKRRSFSSRLTLFLNASQNPLNSSLSAAMGGTLVGETEGTWQPGGMFTRLRIEIDVPAPVVLSGPTSRRAPKLEVIYAEEGSQPERVSMSLAPIGFAYIGQGRQLFFDKAEAVYSIAIEAVRRLFVELP